MYTQKIAIIFDRISQKIMPGKQILRKQITPIFWAGKFTL